MKIAFLDRDDTIIKDYPDELWKYQNHPEFLADSIKALKLIIEKGYEIIIVTNQYLIEEGFITQQQYDDFNTEFQKVLIANDITVLKTYYCPDSRESNSPNLKPNPGMVKQALIDYPKIDLSNSFVIGDSKADIGLAKNMNLPIFAINQIDDYQKLTSVSSLYEAVLLI